MSGTAVHLLCGTGDIVPRTGRPNYSVYNSSSVQLTLARRLAGLSSLASVLQACFLPSVAFEPTGTTQTAVANQLLANLLT